MAERGTVASNFPKTMDVAMGGDIIGPALNSKYPGFGFRCFWE